MTLAAGSAVLSSTPHWPPCLTPGGRHHGPSGRVSTQLRGAETLVDLSGRCGWGAHLDLGAALAWRLLCCWGSENGFLWHPGGYTSDTGRAVLCLLEGGFGAPLTELLLCCRFVSRICMVPEHPELLLSSSGVSAWLPTRPSRSLSGWVPRKELVLFPVLAQKSACPFLPAVLH